MNSFQHVYSLNTEVSLNPYKWSTGNSSLPLDFLEMAQVPRPPLGAGLLPPEGPYATSIDVSNSEALQPDKEPPNYVVPVAITALILAFLFMR